jgi:DNA polymerase III delta subunit
MVTLVHGNDNLTSRKYFLDQKDENSLTFDAESLNPIELAQSMQGSGLFETSVNKIFIENLFTRKGSKNQSSVVEIIKKNKDTQIFIYADKDVGVKSLSDFPKFENQNFKIPQNIWVFLDAIKPNNPKNVSSFHSALSGTEPEIVFSMIIRQFRLLLGISSGSTKNADEVKKLAPWQKTKLQRQLSLFGQENVKKIYKSIYKIEKQQKTGATNLSLIQAIDILLLQI